MPNVVHPEKLNKVFVFSTSACLLDICAIHW